MILTSAIHLVALRTTTRPDLSASQGDELIWHIVFPFLLTLIFQRVPFQR